MFPFTSIQRPPNDKQHEECGVCGIFGSSEASKLVALGLQALQHRGQEAVGIASYDSTSGFHVKRNHGLVRDTFNSDKPHILAKLLGHASIGHVRYSTAGNNDNPEDAFRNFQPLFAGSPLGSIAIAHNGNLTNATEVKDQLIKDGSIFQSTSDTEVILHLFAKAKEEGIVDRIASAMKQITGAYALVILVDNKLIGVRDPYGIRPLVLGRRADSYVLASETCALDIMEATFEREINPGEVVVITSSGIESFFPFEKVSPRQCLFEYFYFARPDSKAAGRNMYSIRVEMGKILAEESPADVDLIVDVPDSAMPAAIGYSRQSGIPREVGIFRDHYLGRTFILPSQASRELGAKMKYHPNDEVLRGKRIVLIDDSIVRGTTLKRLCAILREVGVTEIHVRISSPPVTHPCVLGIDTPDQQQLLAAQHDLAGMQAYLNVDSLAFLSLDGLYKAVHNAPRNSECPQACDACFTGAYPGVNTCKNKTPASS